MTSPTISVGVPCYNKAAFVTRCLSSLQRQRSVSFEVIVVDDCSSDDSRPCAKAPAAADSRIRVIENKGNLGPSGTFNVALSESRVPWFMLVSADDYAADNAAFEAQLRAALEHNCTEQCARRSARGRC